MKSATGEAPTELGQQLRLPCGVILKNRLVKAAMSDSLGDGAGNPTEHQIKLYQRWAEGGAALALVGEMQIGPHYPEKPGNLVLGPDADLSALKRLTEQGSVSGAQIWPQLGHAGALAYSPVSAPKGPSPLHVEGLQCDGLTLEEIEELPHAYASAALLAKKIGFGGVQIHAGHGFLLSQFLSPLFNKRSDPYGGSIDNRFRIVGKILEAVRNKVGPDFPVGIKINSTDKLVGGLGEEEALDVVRLLDETTVDLIDISGGTYFPGAASSSDGVRVKGPYFADFARRAKRVTSVPIMLTGGFKTRAGAVAAVKGGLADAVGLARSMVLEPELPNIWLKEASSDPVFPVFNAPQEGAVTAWYTMRLAALGEENEHNFELSAEEALEIYERRDAERVALWLKRFGRVSKSSTG
ncbi:NADH:flavin oxidoreductase/NADH oxidase family protein [Roseibium sp. HPY-6]|uniref:NADH:flavin oxidoreductase/NADH oxidase family protein n=1 Tax=Roseibium sp. HPY-6 TaxID=3229852 RepID=UPI0033906319